MIFKMIKEGKDLVYRTLIVRMGAVGTYGVYIPIPSHIHTFAFLDAGIRSYSSHFHTTLDAYVHSYIHAHMSTYVCVCMFMYRPHTGGSDGVEKGCWID